MDIAFLAFILLGVLWASWGGPVSLSELREHYGFSSSA